MTRPHFNRGQEKRIPEPVEFLDVVPVEEANLDAASPAAVAAP